MEMQEETEVRKEAMERAAQVVMSVAPTEEDIRRHENLHLRSFADAACQTVPVSINLPGEDSGTGGEDGDHPHSVKALKKRAQMLERLNMGGGGTTGILAVPRIAAFFSQPPAFVSLLLGPSGKAAVAMGTVEPMGRGELERLIAELYTAKISADRIDDRCQYPRETFDTFVIGHLTKSLGLKSLAVAKIYQLVVTLKSFLPQPRKKIRRGKSTKSARKGAAAAAGPSSSSSSSSSSRSQSRSQSRASSPPPSAAFRGGQGVGLAAAITGALGEEGGDLGDKEVRASLRLRFVIVWAPCAV